MPGGWPAPGTSSSRFPDAFAKGKGWTEWIYTGDVRRQTRQIDDEGRLIAPQEKLGAPWWWGMKDETRPTAPWWSERSRDR